MNDQPVDLALTFLQSHPDAAATVLEQQPVDEVANFLSNLPHQYASQVIEKMLPQYSARLIKLLTPDTAAGFLAQMDVSLIAPIIRHTDRNLGRQLLEILPDKTGIACRLLLDYPEEAVGAWMVVKISTLPDICTAGEALIRLSQEKETIPSGLIPVVNRDRLIKGLVQIGDLLTAASNSPVSSIMNKNPDPIPARSALSTAINHPMWAWRDTLAVVNRKQMFVGILRHRDMRRGLNQLSTSIDQPAGADPITGLYEVYGLSLAALVNTVTEISQTNSSRT